MLVPLYLLALAAPFWPESAFESAKTLVFSVGDSSCMSFCTSSLLSREAIELLSSPLPPVLLYDLNGIGLWAGFSSVRSKSSSSPARIWGLDRFCGRGRCWLDLLCSFEPPRWSDWFGCCSKCGLSRLLEVWRSSSRERTLCSSRSRSGECAR